MNNSTRAPAILTCLALLLAGCGTGQPSIPTATPASTSTPVLTPTPSLTPTPTATPAAGIGVPTHMGSWQLTILHAEAITSISKKSAGSQAVSAPSGQKYLIVTIGFRNLDPASQSALISYAKDFTAIDTNGEKHPLDGFGFSTSNMSCVRRTDCSPVIAYPKDSGESTLAFAVNEDLTQQSWQLQFRDLPPIPFSLDHDISAGYETEVIAKQSGSLPMCDTTQWQRPGKAGLITYERRDDNHVAALGVILPNSSADTTLCANATVGNIQYARDGAALISLSPQQGWLNLALVEPDNTIITLVQNAMDVVAAFSPDGRFVLFTVRPLGKLNRQLYTFDRQSASASLLKEADTLDFRFMGNNRLYVSLNRNLGDEWKFERYLGNADGSDLVEPPEEIDRLYDLASDNTRMLYLQGDSVWFNVPGDSSASKKLTGKQPTITLSDDDRFVLAAIFGGGQYQVKLWNPETGKQTMVLQTGGPGSPNLSFSPDGQWGLVLFERLGESTTQRNPSKLTIIRTSDGSILKQIESVMSAYFSPDSSHLVYSTANKDGTPEMFVLTLADGSQQSLGMGLATGWWAGE